MGQKSTTPYREVVEKQIKAHPVLMYSTTYCGYCVKAMSVFGMLKVKPHVVYLDKDPDGDEISMALEEITKQDTVPCIFIGGRHIGGFTQLVQGLKARTIQDQLKNLNIAFEDIIF